MVVDIANPSFKIMVDADACPVKQEIVGTARLYQVGVMMVASYDHYLAPIEGVSMVQVDRSAESADLYIANHLNARDILVTQDFGLATIGLAKKAIVLSNRGQIYTDEIIDYLLETRHQHAKQRRRGKHSKGPKPFSSEDRNKFQQTLTKVLEHLQENSLV
ncbi:MAG TPA: YaiI/YqxD family protein [Bacilli bacterium]